MEGLEYADSFNTNPNKFLLTNFDCSCLWVRDRFKLTSALVVDPLYLQHTHADTAIDYRYSTNYKKYQKKKLLLLFLLIFCQNKNLNCFRHWSIPLSRRFRSLKLWFVIRSYGISGLQSYIRKHCQLAKEFEAHVRKDSRFEICNDVVVQKIILFFKKKKKIKLFTLKFCY